MKMKNIVPFLSLLIALIACSNTENENEIPEPKPEPSNPETYTNPVFGPVLADPTVIRSDDGWFYAYGTEDNWGDGKENHLIPIIRSKNLTEWTYLRDAFVSKPSWKKEGYLWAPDIVKVGNTNYLYYAVSLWGDPDPGIGLATANSLSGPFIDYGKIFTSVEIDVPNSIDPFFFEENGKKYLFWGSFSTSATQGTYGVELSEDGRSVASPTTKFKVAAGDVEAVMIHKRNGYYYFFGSKGSCCEGVNSTYHVIIGRSNNLRGPYLDKSGKDLAIRGNGTVILKGNETYAGPGHHSRIITDDEGTDWLLYHAIHKATASDRVLMLDKVNWVNDWPVIGQGSPSTTEQKAPVFNVK